MVQLPKHLLKSRNFQEECVFAAIELLSVHFAQWSYNISFPELATIPLIRLRKFHEKTAIESFRRVVKRFVDMVWILMNEFSVFLYHYPGKNSLEEHLVTKTAYLFATVLLPIDNSRNAMWGT